VDNTTARLLAGDANTYARFVPDANWNGTVNNGITFHAWDQTSGSAGGTADLTASNTVLDQFNTASYAGNDGTVNWANNWQELNKIGGGNQDINGIGASREADLSGATSATLSFDYWEDFNQVQQAGAGVHLDISSDGGASWTTLHDYVMNGALPSSSTPASFDISAYISGNTQIRFVGTGDVDSYFEQQHHREPGQRCTSHQHRRRHR
jgi:hypothetical protein